MIQEFGLASIIKWTMLPGCSWASPSPNSSFSERRPMDPNRFFLLQVEKVGNSPPFDLLREMGPGQIGPPAARTAFLCPTYFCANWGRNL